MKSCTFNDLPLAEVRATVFLTSGLQPRFDDVVKLADALVHKFPSVTRFNDGIADGSFAIQVGHTHGATLSSEDGSESLLVAPGSVTVKWQKGTSEYPRFASLKESLALAIQTLNIQQINAVQLVYTIHEPRDKSLNAALKLPNPSSDEGGDIIEFTFAQRHKSSIDYRIRAIAQHTGFLIESTGGKVVAEGDSPMIVLEEMVHDTMQSVFASYLTEEIKNDWGYCGIN